MLAIEELRNIPTKFIPPYENIVHKEVVKELRALLRHYLTMSVNYVIGTETGEVIK